MLRSHLACLLAAAALLPACGTATPADGDTSTASEAIDTSSQSSNEGSLLASAVVPVSATMADSEAAAAAAKQMAATFTVPACVNSVTAGATVTYTLTDCTGPWGLIEVNGTLTAVYSVKGGALDATFTSSGLTVGKDSLDIDAQATYTQAGSANTLEVTTQGTGTGPLGNSVKRKGSYTVTWTTSSMCASVNGEWSTVGALGRTWSTSVSDLKACTGSCPSSGTIVYTGGITGTTVTIDFTGATDASYSFSTGQSGEIPLFCTAS